MLKNYILFFLCLFSGVQLATAQTYTFTHSTATYTALTSPTIVSPSTPWLEFDQMIPIGFPFTFVGTVYDSVEVNNAGAPAFEAGTIDAAFTASSANHRDLNYPSGSTTQSHVAYELTGSVGNRILKIEYNNVGFNGATNDNYINYQIWLYESDNTIEARIGPNSVPDPTDSYGGFLGPMMGVVKSSGSTFIYSLMLKGSSASPITTPYSFTPIPYLYDIPAPGKVYTFTPSAVGVESVSMSSMDVFPNPAAEFVTLQYSPSDVKDVAIYDVMGRKLQLPLEKSGITTLKVDVRSLPQGYYHAMSADRTIRTASFVVKR